MVCCEHINGATIGISVNAGTMDTTAHTTGVFSGTARFDVGAILDGTLQFFDGRIMQQTFSKVAWTQSQINYYYNNGLGRMYPFV
jgi:hypothetical protein